MSWPALASRWICQNTELRVFNFSFSHLSYRGKKFFDDSIGQDSVNSSKLFIWSLSKPPPIRGITTPNCPSRTQLYWPRLRPPPPIDFNLYLQRLNQYRLILFCLVDWLLFCPNNNKNKQKLSHFSSDWKSKKTQLYCRIVTSIF